MNLKFTKNPEAKLQQTTKTVPKYNDVNNSQRNNQTPRSIKIRGGTNGTIIEVSVPFASLFFLQILRALFPFHCSPWKRGKKFKFYSNFPHVPPLSILYPHILIICCLQSAKENGQKRNRNLKPFELGANDIEKIISHTLFQSNEIH